MVCELHGHHYHASETFKWLQESAKPELSDEDRWLDFYQALFGGKSTFVDPYKSDISFSEWVDRMVSDTSGSLLSNTEGLGHSKPHDNPSFDSAYASIQNSLQPSDSPLDSPQLDYSIKADTLDLPSLDLSNVDQPSALPWFKDLNHRLEQVRDLPGAETSHFRTALDLVSSHGSVLPQLSPLFPPQEHSESDEADDGEFDTGESLESDETDALTESAYDQRKLESSLRTYLYDVIRAASTIFAIAGSISHGAADPSNSENEGKGQRGAPNSVDGTSFTSNSSSSAQSERKYSKRLRDGQHEDSEEEEDEHRKRCRQLPASKTPVTTLKLGCPFYKRHPSLHQKPMSCRGPGWDAVHRLKEHIYRVHAMPIHCRRCQTVFVTDSDLTAHSQAEAPCSRMPSGNFSGFNKEQEKKMRSKKKRPNMSEPEKWLEVYKILFPSDDESDFPTPCKSSLFVSRIAEMLIITLDVDIVSQKHFEQMSAFGNHIKAELPGVLRPRLQDAVPVELIVGEQALDRIVECVRTAVDTIWQIYSLQIASIREPAEGATFMTSNLGLSDTSNDEQVQELATRFDSSNDACLEMSGNFEITSTDPFVPGLDISAEDFESILSSFPPGPDLRLQDSSTLPVEEWSSFDESLRNYSGDTENGNPQFYWAQDMTRPT